MSSGILFEAEEMINFDYAGSDQQNMAAKLSIVNQLLSSVLLTYQALLTVNKADGQPAQETAQMIIDQVQPTLESNLFEALGQLSDARSNSHNDTANSSEQGQI